MRTHEHFNSGKASHTGKPPFTRKVALSILILTLVLSTLAITSGLYLNEKRLTQKTEFCQEAGFEYPIDIGCLQGYRQCVREPPPSDYGEEYDPKVVDQKKEYRCFKN
jgi:hypothetical protein